MTSIAGWLRASLRLPLVALAILAGLLLATTLIPASEALGKDAHQRVRNVCVRSWCLWVARILGIQIQCHGSISSTAGLTVANHISWIDILALATLRNFVFIAKSEVSEWPLLGSMFQGIGTLFVRRGNSNSSALIANQMTDRLEHGIPLLLFPEATTTDGSLVRRFGAKLFDPATRTGATVQPVGIRYEGPSNGVAPFIGDDTFLAHLMRVAQANGIHIRLSFGPEMHAAAETKESLARACQNTVTQLI